MLCEVSVGMNFIEASMEIKELIRSETQVALKGINKTWDIVSLGAWLMLLNATNISDVYHGSCMLVLDLYDLCYCIQLVPYQCFVCFWEWAEHVILFLSFWIKMLWRAWVLSVWFHQCYYNMNLSFSIWLVCVCYCSIVLKFAVYASNRHPRPVYPLVPKGFVTIDEYMLHKYWY